MRRTLLVRLMAGNDKKTKKARNDGKQTRNDEWIKQMARNDGNQTSQWRGKQMTAQKLAATAQNSAMTTTKARNDE